MRLPATETVKVTLGRPWGPYAAGTEVEVDKNRAGTLDEAGYLKAPKAEKPSRKRGR